MSLLRIRFRSQPKLCDVCHDMTEKSMSFNDVGIVNVVYENDYEND